MFTQDKFKSRLKLLRSNNNMSARALGDSIGVSHTAILQFEKGITLPAVDTLVALADYFDVSVDYLLGVSDEPNPVYKPEHGVENMGQADKKPGQDEIDKLVEELDEESVIELKKYAEYLRIRQTLDSGRDESSAGLDAGEEKEGIK